METMTSFFTSNPCPSRPSAQVDNIIFYSGPASKKAREPAPTIADECRDIDEFLAQTESQGWPTGVEHFDVTAGFDLMGVGKAP